MLKSGYENTFPGSHGNSRTWWGWSANTTGGCPWGMLAPPARSARPREQPCLAAGPPQPLRRPPGPQPTSTLPEHIACPLLGTAFGVLTGLYQRLWLAACTSLASDYLPLQVGSSTVWVSLCKVALGSLKQQEKPPVASIHSQPPPRPRPQPPRPQHFTPEVDASPAQLCGTRGCFKRVPAFRSSPSFCFLPGMIYSLALAIHYGLRSVINSVIVHLAENL